MTTLKIWHVILLVIVLCAFTELVTFYLRYERCSLKTVSGSTHSLVVP